MQQAARIILLPTGFPSKKKKKKKYFVTSEDMYSDSTAFYGSRCVLRLVLFLSPHTYMHAHMHTHVAEEEEKRRGRGINMP
jgi:hypothetical protein